MQSFLRLTLSFLIMVFFMGVLIMAPDISECWAAHGISIDGKLKYDADFKQFDYTSEQARKGGTLLLHDLGSFDKMNPFTLKGSAPAGLNNLIFETLTVGSLDEPFASYGLANNWSIATSFMAFNYNVDSGEWASLPLGLRLEKLIKVGNLPARLFAEIEYNFADSGVAPETTFRIAFIPLL